MRILLAVIDDLYTFTISTLFGWGGGSGIIARSDARLSLPPSRSLATRTVDRSVLPVLKPISSTLPQKHTIVYCLEARMPLRTVPDEVSDSTIATLFYGDMVMVLESGNPGESNSKWVRVAAGNKIGYVPVTAIAEKAGDVYPTFGIGEENGPRAANTVKLRMVIRDEFSTSLTELPLQAHEYVYYKLVRRGARIAWPDIRPRTPGAWKKILTSVAGISITPEPSTGTVMEYVSEEGKAHLSYVEKVSPNGSIFLSEADFPDRGIYNERTLTESEWRRLNPVFISVV